MPLTRKRGRYWYGFTRVNGSSSKEQSTGCEERGAAEKVLAEWEHEAADPHSAAKRRATPADALGASLKQCKEPAATSPPKLGKGPADSSSRKARLGKTAFPS